MRRGREDTAPTARTPQFNPIETEWREIKAAIADIFFDGLDRMRDAIRRMIRNGEIPIVKMFGWLLAATPAVCCHVCC